MKLVDVSINNYRQFDNAKLSFDNDYYIVLLKDAYDAYFAKENKSKAQACLKENTVYGVLAAYRLFYVGCSRARKNLAIVIDNAVVVGFKERLKSKFEEISFEVEDGN